MASFRSVGEGSTPSVPASFYGNTILNSKARLFSAGRFKKEVEMLNKHLLQSRLKSLAHYKEEIDKLKQAAKATDETRGAVLASLGEFFPFNKGDVIVYNGHMVKVLEFDEVDEYNGPRFRFHYSEPSNSYTGSWKTDNRLFSLPVADIEKVKVIDASYFEPVTTTP